MESPAEPDAAQWQTLTHAYGPAVDVPGLIRALHQGDDTTVDEAGHELYGARHTGTWAASSPSAVPPPPCSPSSNRC